MFMKVYLEYASVYKKDHTYIIHDYKMVTKMKTNSDYTNYMAHTGFINDQKFAKNPTYFALKSICLILSLITIM